jgi:hypothetical protein
MYAKTIGYTGFEPNGFDEDASGRVTKVGGGVPSAALTDQSGVLHRLAHSVYAGFTNAVSNMFVLHPHGHPLYKH